MKNTEIIAIVLRHTEYLPEALNDEEITLFVSQAISETGAASMKDMGKVMGWLKPKIQGRADMGAVSAQVRQKLNA